LSQTRVLAVEQTAASGGEVLSDRALNRALLARQMLLRREAITPLEAIEHLAALQAQDARPPFLSLWSRLEGFHREDLRRLLHKRLVVRGTMMRGTLHLVSAADYPAFRAAIQDSLDKISLSLMRERGIELDVDRLTDDGRELFADGPHTFATVRAGLSERYPGLDTAALAFAPRLRLPLLSVPSGGRWAYPGNPTFEPAERWIDPPIAPRPNLQALVRRFLAAHGPAAVSDMRGWSTLTRLERVFAAMADDLIEFRDERGRVLYDLNEAPRPPEDVHAPIRLLPLFDGAVLGHVDPRRTTPEDQLGRYGSPNGRIPSRILIDGFAAGRWRPIRLGGAARLALSLYVRITRAQKAELEDEALAMIRFAEPDADNFAVTFEQG
jgi:hypothetical protein